VGPPDGLKEFAMRHRFSGLRNQVTQKIELFRSQPNILLSRSNLSRLEIDLEVLRHKRMRTRLRRRWRPPQGCANPGEQLFFSEGLFDVVVSAGVEHFDLFIFLM